MLEEKSDKLKIDINSMVTVVVPTLNEEEGIARVIQELHSVGLRNIMVIDGYSRDKTVEIAEKSGGKVFFQQGRGKTGALKTAVDHVDTPFILVIDGDFTYDASSIGRLLQHMQHYDEIIGARVPSERKSMTSLHKLGNKVITRLFNLMMNTCLSDVCSGLYLLRTDTAREIDMATAGFDVEVEIAAQVATSGRITEVPINYRPRLGRQKLSTWKSGFRIIRSIFGLAKSYNPGVFYSMIGSLLLIPAGVLLAVSLLQSLAGEDISNSWFIVGLSMLMVAIQSMSVGVVSLVMRRAELRINRRLNSLGASRQYIQRQTHISEKI
ncbi:MAG TPA: glycosyltransferase family 2 protein [Nitrososphaera sp.]|nr:glycosyltransferase family 2 protein [Nitrososphaera sp.]